ncbi:MULTISPECIES: NAD(P)-dependent oxidoreductase [Olivibacter]|jgi:3-hydroxyisobutyrate dehydrogenase|uniref:NAD(P)-dependent oxidoreductase n=2 Tax=Olivibacter TaxID=376469 RepID=A0ABV6HEI5_9SPHI|nr:MULTISPECIES: NAD(P)-dependent oxidoreductase [Olivibacter]MCL4641399.1 NAD(P)-dependent oxidoreductase [Olivibacter sp. UJ_SKK_5.1]MDM8177339.1 NAD(P)-dependent oxidoreductase [Olivibacter sp. 47]MDX3912051.1 NAD(P)-dependent oxidoreductase [Pseudosphingobacterium sp.]QEK99788.1 NAD(P)-dependent oxidoreductase [Olivibacter sp. LS-1]
MTDTIGWIGLGNMGYPMAKNLLKAGYALNVYNRTASKAEGLVNDGATLASSIKDLCVESEVIITMLSDDQAVKGIFLGEGGLLNCQAEGKLVINMSTVSPRTSYELEEMSKAVGARFLEAPVSGSVKPAEDGTLLILVGGDEDNYRAAQPIFEKLGKLSFWLGSVGAGSSAKLAINYFLALTLEGLAETVLFAKKNGIKAEDMLRIVNEGACGSPLTKLKTNAIVTNSYPAAFALKHMVKDLRLAVEQGIDFPLAQPLAETYKKAFDKGLGEEDVMAIITYLETLSAD